MKIFYGQLAGDEPCTVDIDSHATLSDLTTLLREAEGIDDRDMLQLVLGTTVLGANQGERTLDA